MSMWQYLTALLLITVQTCKAFPAQRCEEFTDLDVSHAIIGTSLKVRLLLYTRENSTCGLLMSHTNLTAHPQFSLSRPTTFVIHGYRPSGSPPMWLKRITELLLVRKDINIIVVDWNNGAANLNYFKAVQNTRKAADNITSFIKKMQDEGASLSSIHMIGVSLGAHMSGLIGASLNGTIGRITGLDPAGPLFTGHPPEDRLDPTDAKFVDVLHTDIDSLGFRQALGHIDFYANGGTDQPGCPKTIFSGGAYLKCDHQRSVLLFLDSLDWTCASRAYPCSSYNDFLDGKCLSCERFGAAGCPIFGYDVIKWKDALLKLKETKTYFATNTESPFCMTNYRVDVMIWNKEVRWGYITVKLHGDGTEAVATIDHKSSEFKTYTETKLLANFDKDIQSVKKVSLNFSTGNVFQPKRKLRVLRVRLTNLERKERLLCRYDVLIEENKEVTFRPVPCEESNF
ncbi:lipase member H-like [Acanthochromis polyacanthus]|uniref:Lipase, member Ia n=1 Tax=Acanthochromis polyacanthus TaxID=80966 RepID=A0A3Q1FEP0_9TELE|nr:lipase member H-like [Acanthochromis polyacanthus]XP_022046228.1 lipase member H-like [Acanthochromis polyacanthus]XP_022046229.1 lipase member H-like [Acanthochromis polyacanthus]